MSHYIRNCHVCRKVIGQCRCPSKDKQQQWGLCDECEAAGEKMPDKHIISVTISRTVVQHRMIEIKMDEACLSPATMFTRAGFKALEQAPNLDFSGTEKDAEYAVVNSHEVK